MIKKIAIAIWILTALFLGILCLNYYGNRKLIDKYGEGVYQQNELGFLGFTQPYINHFNRGNVYYQLGDYKKAQLEYQYALNLMPQEPYDCKIRVNYALSYVTPIDVKEIDEDNYKDIIEICEQAKAILSEKDCATEDNDGHYYAAQKLYNEINEFIESLKNQFENPPPPDNPDETNTPTPTPTPPQGSPKPDADHTDTPTPTPEGGTDTPTPTPSGGTDTPTPSPSGGTDTPTPTPGGEGTDTPTPTPGGEGTGTPTPTPGGEGDTPTPTPGGEGTGTPTPTPGGSGEGTGTPTPTPGEGDPGEGTPTPTPSPEDRIRDVQDRANRDRYGGSGDESGYGDEWNFGDSASW